MALFSYGHNFHWALSEVIESYKAKITINIWVTKWSAWIREVIVKRHQLWVNEKFLEIMCEKHGDRKLVEKCGVNRKGQ